MKQIVCDYCGEVIPFYDPRYTVDLQINQREREACKPIGLTFLPHRLDICVGCHPRIDYDPTQTFKRGMANTIAETGLLDP